MAKRSLAKDPPPIFFTAETHGMELDMLTRVPNIRYALTEDNRVLRYNGMTEGRKTVDGEMGPWGVLRRIPSMNPEHVPVASRIEMRFRILEKEPTLIGAIVAVFSGDDAMPRGWRCPDGRVFSTRIASACSTVFPRTAKEKKVVNGKRKDAEPSKN